jgi:ubiquinone/menaquinone biosynthesis C-methylase UbiE
MEVFGGKMDSAAQRKQFWDDQAKAYSGSTMAVNSDPHLEEMSTREILKLIPDGLRVCDVGCGNGHPIIEAALQNPHGVFSGCDSSVEMVDIAKARNTAPNLTFWHGDITTMRDQAPTFDIVLGRRLLVNLNYGEKLAALDNIRAMLKPHGKYIMVECWQEPLDKINAMRKIIGAEEIKVRSVNEYLTQSFFTREICQRFTPKSIAPKTYGSLYYLESRVFNAGGDYNAPINLLAKKLIEAGLDPLTYEYGYCPESIWELQPR